MKIEKIVSGGQTGVDRAALDVAIRNHIPHGGWCPRGRKAEDGIIDDHYRLRETGTDDYARRTEWNVRDSDGTLILSRGKPDGGTSLTLHHAGRLGKPHFLVDLNEEADTNAVAVWLKGNHIRVLNVAGPRESKHPGIYEQACDLLQRLIEE
ncbi:MAG: putative molybdenum carrier protein [Gammaproteobacteria bacterium]|jgi:hypothetical protein